MLLVLDGMLLVGLALFAVGGARRGPWPELVTLGGLLLGALLVGEWGDVWGRDLGSAFGFLGAGGARLLVRTLLFLVPLLVVGYGGARLLPGLGALTLSARVLGGLLAVFNGAAIFALLLRNWDYSQGAGSTLRDDPGTLFLLNWAGWFPLLLALGGLGAVAWVMLSRPRRTATPVSATLPPATSTGPAGAGSLLAAPGAPLSRHDTTWPPPVFTAPAPLPSRLVAAPAPAEAEPPAPPIAAGAPAQPESATGAGSHCRTCNYALAPGAAFCPNCGTPVPL